MRQHLRRNAASVITDGKGNIVGMIFNNQFNRSCCAGVEQGVLQKIDGYLFNQYGIHGDHDELVGNGDLYRGAFIAALCALQGFGDNRPMYEKQTVPFSDVFVLDNVSKGYSYSMSVKAEKSFTFGLDLMASYTYGLSKTINNGSSSIASSNFQNNYTHGNPNKPELANSNFNIPHQLMISAYQHINWQSNPGRTIDNKTTIGLVYTGNSGSPYSVYVNGDVNGDGGYNDLLYIPTDSEVDAMYNAGLFRATSAYTAEQQRDNFKEWLNNERYIKSHRGEFFERNADNEKWENRLDLHADHKFGFKLGRELRYFQIGLDIINFTNMLCKRWGATLSQRGYNYYAPLSYSGGKYQFLRPAGYDMRSYNDNYSRWRMQLTARLTF